jgi:hypothetical protein
MYIRVNTFYGTAKRYFVTQNHWFAYGIVFILCLLLVQNSETAMPMAMGSTLQSWSDRPPTVDPTFGLPIPSAVKHPTSIPAWIWASKTHNNQTIYLRHSFKLATVPHVVQLYAAAEDHLEIFLNGKKITTTFHRANKLWRRACNLSVAIRLHRGDNTIAIRAQNANGNAGVILWMIAGSKTLCLTNGQWHVAIRPPGGMAWTRSRFKDSTWAHAVVQAPYGERPRGQISPWPSCGYLAHLYFQPQRVTVLHGRTAFKGLSSIPAALTPEDIATIRPEYQGRSLLAPAHHIDLVVTPGKSKPQPELLISFRQEVAGRIQVRGTGGTVLIGTGESRGEALHGPWGGVHTLNLAAGKTQSTPYSAFRYATVSFKGPGKIKLNRLRLDFKYYPVAYRGAFACSDPLLAKIWYTGAYTAHLCMQEQIWDAPKRDRAMWMGDLQVSGQVINNVFLDRFLMELTMQDLRQQAQGGRLATALPVNYVNNIPGYSNAWICGLADFYKHTGAIKYLRSQHQLLLSMLRYIKKGFNRKNLFVNKHKKWCFVDWAPELNGNWNTPDVNSPQALAATDLYTCWAVRRAVYLFHVLGDTANAAKYAHWDRQIIRAARQYLVNSRTHTYTNLRQVNAMAIDSHVADAQQRAAIYKRILGPKCASWKQQATPYYNNFVLFAVGHLGHTDEGLTFAQKYWGGMIREGATTFWEAYDNAWPKKHFHRYLKADNGQGYFVSLCHGWSTGVTNWLTEHVLGVRPAGGGFTGAVIVPHLGYLHWARGRVPTPRGNIVLSVARHGTSESLHITLPPGVKALVGVVGRSIMVNGVAVSPVRRSRQRCYINLIKSGSYRVVGSR